MSIVEDADIQLQLHVVMQELVSVHASEDLLMEGLYGVCIHSTTGGDSDQAIII